MSGGGDAGFWALAAGASLVVHAMIAATLFAIPAPRSSVPHEPRIDIASARAGDVTRIAASRVPQAAAPRPATAPRAIAPSATAVAPVVAKPAQAPNRSELLAPTTAARSDPLRVTPVPAAASVATSAVAPSPATGGRAVEAAATTAPLAAAEQPREVAAARDTRPVDAVASPPPLGAIAATAPIVAQPAERQVVPPRAGEPALSSQADTAVTAASPEMQVAAAERDRTVLDHVPAAPVSSQAAPARVATFAAGAPVTAEAAVPGRVAPVTSVERPAAAPRVVAGASAAPVRPSAPEAIAGAPVAAAPTTGAGGAAIVAAPPARLEPVTAPPSPAPAPTVVPSAATAAAVEQPSAGASLAPVAESGAPQELAMIVPQPDPLRDVERQSSGRAKLTDFLAEHEAGTCTLVLPGRVGTREATIDAFTDQPDAVDRLGVELQRVSGMSVNTSMRAVSPGQCVALVFARSLAQYPEFPLRISLTASRIHNGAQLAGVVSGLRKSTLYVMIVDDEGKAELVQQQDNLRTSVANFRAHMTLTNDPVNTEQLLVVIASDGPLKTVAAQPGMPADEFFSRLTTEIILKNRAIHYGITSFVVR
jgi:hypothetical protein